MKKILIAMGALALVASGTVKADDTMVKKPLPSLSKSTTSGPLDRTLEIRVGPRVSWLTGDFRVYNTSTVNIEDDLGLDDPSPGVQFNVDWQFASRWHFTGELTYDNYDVSGTTSRAFTTHKGDVISAGAATSVEGDILTFEGRIGYDLIKNNTYRLQPFIGGKGAYAEATLTGTGTIKDANVPTARTGSLTTKEDITQGTYIGGIDQRLYISRDWYVGAEVGASGMDNYYLISGDGYMGYEFSKNMGVRIGYDANYVDYENSGKTTSAQPLLGATYVQFVWGF